MTGFDNTTVVCSGERLTPSSAQDISTMRIQSTDVARINGTGSPEGTVSANPSSLFHDTSSGNFYIKQTGTGNTGWVPMPGAVVLGNENIDFKIVSAVTPLFTTANRPFFVVGIFFTGINVSATISNPLLNFGWTAPNYTDLQTDLTGTSIGTGLTASQIPLTPNGQVPIIPASTTLSLKVDVASVATNDVEKVSVLGFYI